MWGYMIQLEWDTAQKDILCYTFIEPWTWDEYEATNPQRDRMFSESDGMIDIILDFTNGAQIPARALPHFRKAAAWDSPKRGVVIVVGVSTLLQALGTIMFSVFPQSALKAPRPARNRDAARSLIKVIRLQRDTDHSPV